MQTRQLRITGIVLLMALSLNIFFWLYGRSFQAQWMNVPPVPKASFQEASALGDAQLAYRANAIMIQNLGDSGGRSHSFAQYNYERLTQWLFLMDRLDPRSNFIPYLAAYYFGAVSDTQKLEPLTLYLAHAGERPQGEKWRWLAHAAYLARFEMQDLDLALHYAQRLSALEARYDMDLPQWASQMHIFIQNTMGNKQEAYGLMLEILREQASTMHPNEVNFMREYICTRILEPAQARINELCDNIP